MASDADATPAAVIDRLQRAMNRHDLREVLECIDPNYRSAQPAHPNRGFGGRDQVEKNWGALFAGIPDFRADVLDSAVAGNTAWTEWRWTGTRGDGSQVHFRGVTLFGVENGRIVSGRLYMEEVEEDGAGIDEAVQRMAAGTREGE